MSIRNTSVGFLGGGTATSVSGVLRFEGRPDYRTKWEENPNPFKAQLIPAGGGGFIQVIAPDEAQVESARLTTLLAGETKSLDVAAKFRGDRNCYVHIPENFWYPDLKNPIAALPPGRHPFTLSVLYQGKEARVGKFVLVNGDSDDPETIGVEMSL